jgi:hypothetical protein
MTTPTLVHSERSKRSSRWTSYLANGDKVRAGWVGSRRQQNLTEIQRKWDLRSSRRKLRDNPNPLEI